GLPEFGEPGQLHSRLHRGGPPSDAKPSCDLGHGLRLVARDDFHGEAPGLQGTNGGGRSWAQLVDEAELRRELAIAAEDGSRDPFSCLKRPFGPPEPPD